MTSKNAIYRKFQILIYFFLLFFQTTLVNYILKEQTQWKICVIENEFGEVSIDTDLVEENLAAREDIITMGTKSSNWLELNFYQIVCL